VSNGVILIINLLFVQILAGVVTAGEIHISAAISLKEVMNELTKDYANNNPGLKFVNKFDASGSLAKQIENQPTVDIFIPSNMMWMQYLMDRYMLDNFSIRTFTFNTLVFAGNPGKKVSGMNELPRLKKIAIGRPERVAAGEYALESLINSGVYKALHKQLLLSKDSRDSLKYVELGEADGAIVYRTDALFSRRLKIHFVIPQELYSRVVYPMALTVTGARNGDARAFFKYLQGSDARAVLERYGFDVNNHISRH